MGGVVLEEEVWVESFVVEGLIGDIGVVVFVPVWGITRLFVHVIKE